MNDETRWRRLKDPNGVAKIRRFVAKLISS